MNPTTQAIEAKASKVLRAQLVLTLLAVLGFFLLKDEWHALSALCGGLVSVSLLLVLRRGIRRASEVAMHDKKKGMAILYIGAVQRFVLILVLFALGLGVLGLDPLAMFAGFVLAQASNLISARL
ncbi:MAG: ATP synthase subunit I [Pseudomonadota bacterium]